MAATRRGAPVVPALLYFLSYFHRVAPVVVAGDLMAASTFLSFGVMQWLTGLVPDRGWDGALVAGARVYGHAAYRAAFALCLRLAAGAFVSACLARETRGRNIWSAA